MNGHTFASQKDRKTADNPSRHSSAGEHAVAIAPPDYGIDFVDTGTPATAVHTARGVRATHVDADPARTHLRNGGMGSDPRKTLIWCNTRIPFQPLGCLAAPFRERKGHP